jgi:leucyl aminopeptidase
MSDDSTPARTLHCLRREEFEAWRARQPAATSQWLQAHGFDAAPGALLVLPATDGSAESAVLGLGDAHDPLSYAGAPFALPQGEWDVRGELDDEARKALQLGWGLGSYRFDRYRTLPRQPARLKIDDAADAETADVLAACLRVRNLVNTPADDLGPPQLEDALRELAAQHSAEVVSIVGDDLLAKNFPAIHAVGRASHRAPRLLQLQWGDPSHPKLALVGKGVCFDTGGLDIKSADGMRNMKKDMGGAAHAIALAGLVMARRLPVRLSLFVPAVENAIGPMSLRPGDVIATRKGVSVEIDNTDAEGRLVLCDALVAAAEDSPALLLDFATLTGAARVALGPELPAMYSNDESVATDWLSAAASTRDPLWRMPLWRPYLRYLTSNIADIANAGPSKMAGSISAALYLERFVPAAMPWAHLDVYAWNDNDRPGRPAGGEAQGLRAAWAMLKGRFETLSRNGA